MSQASVSGSILEFAETHHKIPALIVSGTRCGKPNCKCASTTYRHRTACLYWYAGGHARRRYVPVAHVEAVRAIIERRRAERREWRLALAESRVYLRLLRLHLRDLQRHGEDRGAW
jgi:hypothetical protein